MKKSILFFAMLLSVTLYGQEPYKISSVIQCEGINADKAYQNAELWLINTFNAPDKVIQLQDKQNKRLAVKAGTNFASHRFDAGSVRGLLIYTINIFFREGRFKVDMVNIQHEANPDMMNPQSLGIIYDTELPPKKIFGMTKKWRKDVYADIKSKINEEYSNFCQNLLEAIKSGASSENNDW